MVRERSQASGVNDCVSVTLMKEGAQMLTRRVGEPLRGNLGGPSVRTLLLVGGSVRWCHCSGKRPGGLSQSDPPMPQRGPPWVCVQGAEDRLTRTLVRRWRRQHFS